MKKRLRPASEGFALSDYYVGKNVERGPTGIACPECGREMGWGHARGTGVVVICSGSADVTTPKHDYVLVDRVGKRL